VVFAKADDGADMAKMIGTFFKLSAAKPLGLCEHIRMLQKTYFYLQLITSYIAYICRHALVKDSLPSEVNIHRFFFLIYLDTINEKGTSVAFYVIYASVSRNLVHPYYRPRGL
jgi:hypothetical protein